MQLLGAFLDEFEILADIDRQKRQAETDADLDLILRAHRRRCRAEHSERRKPKHKSAQSFYPSSENGNYKPPSPAGGGSGHVSEKIFPEPLARGERLAEIETVDDGEAETAGRHGVLFRRAVLVESDLHAGDAGRALDRVNQRQRRMPVAAAVRSEQHDAVTLAAVVVVKIPLAVFIKPDQRIDPAGAIEIGPLVGAAQMRLDDRAADGFEIEHAGVTGEIFLRPGAAAGLDIGVGLGMHGPVIEGALARRL